MICETAVSVVELQADGSKLIISGLNEKHRGKTSSVLQVLRQQRALCLSCLRILPWITPSCIKGYMTDTRQQVK